MPCTLSSLQLAAMAALVSEPSAPSSFSASLPLPGLWGWWPALVQSSHVTLAQTTVETAASLLFVHPCLSCAAGMLWLAMSLTDPSLLT